MAAQSATSKDIDRFRRPSVGSEKDLVARAEALIPVLRSRAEETEAGRTLTAETRRDLMESGVHRIFQPKRFGGVEGSLRAGVDILAAIGQGCSATAWVLVQNLTHNWMVAEWPIEAQEAVWGEEPAVLLSGILIPGVGKARRVEGGYRLSGRWPFLSGVNVCDWALFTAFTDGPNGEKEDRHFLLPRSDFEILDTWRSVGLRGTCSNDAEVRDTFVPEHMTTTIESLKGAVPPPHADSLAFYCPRYAMFGVYIGAAALGAAEAAVAAYIDQAKKRVATSSSTAVANFMTQHIKISEALACLRAARLMLYGVCDLATEILASGRLPNDEERTRFRSEAAFAGRMFTQAVNIVWDAGGGAVIYDQNPLSRAFRDANTAARHLTQNWDINAAAHGRVVIGLPIDNPAL
jgi:3-hydroxy-9,10-secoandrosta-1,3,5(10)-triene-9,17-dione monooxygenase